MLVWVTFLMATQIQAVALAIRFLVPISAPLESTARMGQKYYVMQVATVMIRD